MYFIVGLGNPGAKYEGTRHNVGFEVVDRLADRAGIRISDKKFKARIGRGTFGGRDCLLMLPQTFMNLSGESVGPAVGFFKEKAEHVVVVHDELDLPVGGIRLKRGGGHGGHNGLKSLVQHLGPQFLRVRVGIGRPPPRWDASSYVLGRFAPDERSAVDPALDEAVEAIEVTITEGIDRAMNRFHRQPDAKATGSGE
ncbi:MAG TPA: aminoacyl-tRNA hydrolase [Myxococcales bacterium LLY-WYZ-16_1]|jgi:PTH1 family peptidyl-tRNA hydrolase|nr:aminoacyl-tRNA hydrolase [Myxococcales bacterium LLY-WYZ-16_1]